MVECVRKDIYGVYAEPVDPEEVFNYLLMLMYVNGRRPMSRSS